MPRAKLYRERVDARFTERQRWILSRVAEQLDVSEAGVLRMLVQEIDPAFAGVRVAERLHKGLTDHGGIPAQ